MRTEASPERLTTCTFLGAMKMKSIHLHLLVSLSLACTIPSLRVSPVLGAEEKPLCATESFLWDHVTQIPALERPQMRYARVRVRSIQKLTVSSNGIVEDSEIICGTSHPLIDKSALDFVRNLRFSRTLFQGMAHRLSGYLTVDYDLERQPTLGLHLPPIHVLPGSHFRVDKTTVVDRAGLLRWLNERQAATRHRIVHLSVPSGTDLSVLEDLREAGVENVHVRFEQENQ